MIRIAVFLSTLSPFQAGVDGYGSHVTFFNAPQSFALASSNCCDHTQDVTSRTGSLLQVHGRLEADRVPEHALLKYLRLLADR